MQAWKGFPSGHSPFSLCFFTEKSPFSALFLLQTFCISLLQNDTLTTTWITDILNAMNETYSQNSSMTLTFPAMHGVMGKRDYYVAIMKLALVPKLFKFRDWAELPPEQRAQRVLQKSRIPEITDYILKNEDGYLFSSLTASYNVDPTFT